MNQTKKNLRQVCLAILITCMFVQCDTTDRKKQAETWYNTTKAALFKQSDKKADSTKLEFNQDSTYKTEYQFARGHLFLKRGFNKDRLRMETYYSEDNDFELRREVCENGKVGFEGIFYKGNPYGLACWNYCTGQPQEQGLRLNNEKIGVWKKWDEKGGITEEKDYRNLGKLDLLPVITK